MYTATILTDVFDDPAVMAWMTKVTETGRVW